MRTADVSGGTSQHIAVLPDNAKLAAEKLSVNDLKKTIEEGSGLMPVGRMETGGLDLPVTSGSLVDSLNAVKALPLKGSSGVLKLSELATVEMQDDAATSITRTNGVETLAVSVTKKPDGDTVGISHAVTAMVPGARRPAGRRREVHHGVRPGPVHRAVDPRPHRRGPAGPGLRRRSSS